MQRGMRRLVIPADLAYGDSGAGAFGGKANDPGAGQASGGASGKGDSASRPYGATGNTGSSGTAR